MKFEIDSPSPSPSTVFLHQCGVEWLLRPIPAGPEGDDPPGTLVLQARTELPYSYGSLTFTRREGVTPAALPDPLGPHPLREYRVHAREKRLEVRLGPNETWRPLVALATLRGRA